MPNFSRRQGWQAEGWQTVPHRHRPLADRSSPARGVAHAHHRESLGPALFRPGSPVRGRGRHPGPRRRSRLHPGRTVRVHRLLRRVARRPGRPPAVGPDHARPPRRRRRSGPDPGRGQGARDRDGDRPAHRQRPLEQRRRHRRHRRRPERHRRAGGRLRTRRRLPQPRLRVVDDDRRPARPGGARRLPRPGRQTRGRHLLGPGRRSGRPCVAAPPRRPGVRPAPQGRRRIRR